MISHFPEKKLNKYILDFLADPKNHGKALSSAYSNFGSVLRFFGRNNSTVKITKKSSLYNDNAFNQLKKFVNGFGLKNDDFFRRRQWSSYWCQNPVKKNLP